jgi:hypothetical protein
MMRATIIVVVMRATIIVVISETVIVHRIDESTSYYHEQQTDWTGLAGLADRCDEQEGRRGVTSLTKQQWQERNAPRALWA